MSKKIKQFRWYSETSSNNAPALTVEELTTGTAFKDYMPIAQLGIQAPPGTDFYLNGSVRPIVVGVSGIYDLDVKNGARITQLSFGKNSIDKINKNSTSYLIVDILYGEEDE